jgi:MinD superfamily P-loop ATPase
MKKYYYAIATYGGAAGNGLSQLSEVCPIKNITIINKSPIFNHHCEQCVVCIQFCPQKAINYKNATQKRRRYTNPEISYKELAERNNSGCYPT